MPLPDITGLPQMDYDRIREDFASGTFNVKCDNIAETYMATRVIMDSGIENDERSNWYLRGVLKCEAASRFLCICQAPLKTDDYTPSDQLTWFNYEAVGEKAYWPNAELLTFDEFINRYQIGTVDAEITDDDLSAMGLLDIMQEEMP